MPAGHGGTEGKRYAQPTNSVQLLWSASQIKVIERSATWAWNMQSPFVKSEIINSNPNVREPLLNRADKFFNYPDAYRIDLVERNRGEMSAHTILSVRRRRRRRVTPGKSRIVQ